MKVDDTNVSDDIIKDKFDALNKKFDEYKLKIDIIDKEISILMKDKSFFGFGKIRKRSQYWINLLQRHRERIRTDLEKLYQEYDKLNNEIASSIKDS